MQNATPQVRELTIREIAEALRVPRPRVSYACDAYGIEPSRRAGLVKLFSVNDIPRIKSALARVASRRGGAL